MKARPPARPAGADGARRSPGGTSRCCSRSRRCGRARRSRSPIRELGGDTLHLPPSSPTASREPLEDVARNLERWVHGARRSGPTRRRRSRRSPPRRRGCTSSTRSPTRSIRCQALADVLTLRERWGDCRGRTRRLRRRRQQRRDVAGPRRAACSASRVHVASPAGYELPDTSSSDAPRVARDGAEVRRFTRSARGRRRRRRHLHRRLDVDGRGSRGRRAPPRLRALSGERRADGGGGAAARCSCTACRRIAAKKSPPR